MVRTSVIISPTITSHCAAAPSLVVVVHTPGTASLAIWLCW